MEIPLLPLARMAREIRVTAKWLKEEAEADRVPSLRIGRRLMFSPAAVRDVLVARASAMPNRELAHAG